MLGYIVPDRPELKVREYELYQGYYCGICKSVAWRFGQIPRVVLSYDSVFLALILASLEDGHESLTRERCPVHPVKKRIIVGQSPALSYAADVMLLLAYYKLKDDLHDERSLKAGAGFLFLKNSFQKLMKSHEKKGIILSTCLEELEQTEKNRVPSLDEAAEPFSRLMKELCVPEWLADAKEAEALGRIGYHLGKWIYLIDAFDDLEEDAKSGNYNPLLLQFSWWKNSDNGEEQMNPEKTMDQFRAEIRERVEFSLMCCLTALADAWTEMGREKNRGLIDNIIFFGLRRKTEQVLSNEKRNETDGKSI